MRRAWPCSAPWKPILAERMTCEHVLVAMFLPAVRMSRSGAPNAERFLHFLGRAYTDPSPVVREFIDTHYLETLGRFFFAFQRTLPELSRDDLGFRLNSAMGALSGILAGGDAQRLIRDFTQGQGDQEVTLLSRLISLMVAALKAPLPGPRRHHRAGRHRPHAGGGDSGARGLILM